MRRLEEKFSWLIAGKRSESLVDCPVSSSTRSVRTRRGCLLRKSPNCTCDKELENVSTVTTESGLLYKDIVVGEGPNPPIGFQVAANYVAMVPSGQVFDGSLGKGQLHIFCVGAGQVIKGLDEGMLSMKVGGKRHLYIPGSLAFPKGLSSAPGRPRVARSSPVVFDVSLEYIPGLDDE